MLQPAVLPPAEISKELPFTLRLFASVKLASALHLPVVYLPFVFNLELRNTYGSLLLNYSILELALVDNFW
jgi:hypothetical protein